MELSRIRVECSRGVSHYATKYYSVVHNHKTSTDELIVDANNKVVAQVQALNQVGTTINYKEIEIDNV